MLTVPKTKLSTYGDRAFSSCVQKLWNKLPLYIKEQQSVDNFKIVLKTFMYRKVYHKN